MLVVCFHQIAPYWLQILLVVKTVACTTFSWRFHCFEIVVLYQEPLIEHSECHHFFQYKSVPYILYLQVTPKLSLR